MNVAAWKDVNLFAEFEKRGNTGLVPAYDDRETRNAWAATLLESFAGGSVLNIGGGGRRHFEKHLGTRWRLHELDVTGECDTLVNLDQIDRLPLEDNSFDICCAFDMLEHLEQFHLMTNEIHRVSKSTILVSLPNSAAEIPAIGRNLRYFNDPLENDVYSKFYGLQLAPPGDRHRWWMTFEDIVMYRLWFEQAKECAVEFFLPNDEFSAKRKVFRLIAGERLYLNFFSSSVCIKIAK